MGTRDTASSREGQTGTHLPSFTFLQAICVVQTLEHLLKAPTLSTEQRQDALSELGNVLRCSMSPRDALIAIWKVDDA